MRDSWHGYVIGQSAQPHHFNGHVVGNGIAAMLQKQVGSTGFAMQAIDGAAGLYLVKRAPNRVILPI